MGLATILPIRAAASILSARAELASFLNRTFGGKRDFNKVLGYKDVLTPADYRARYCRGGVAGTIVEAFPNATWRGIGELIEDNESVELTQFEESWFELEHRLKLWAMLKRADIVAGLGRYSVMILGASGNLNEELPTASDGNELLYVSIYGEEECTIKEWDLDSSSARYGLPKVYSLHRDNKDIAKVDSDVHWSRVIHIAENPLDNFVFGRPRLERVWNRLDDLEKVVGGGAEAFWLRANQGFQLDVDPETDLGEDGERALDEEANEYEHGIRRFMRTKGVKIKNLGSDVADFKSPQDAIMNQIAAITGIPQRIFEGSERGQLASEQDRDNFGDRVNDRRLQYAGPFVVQQLADRLIEYGYLPEPEQYEVRWPSQEQSDDQKVGLADKMAGANQKNGSPIFTTDEIRDRAMQMEPIDPSELPEPVEPVVPEPEAELPRAAKRRVHGTVLDKRRHWWRTRKGTRKKPYKGSPNVRKVEVDVA